MTTAELLDLADEAPETLRAFYEERGWGDGLPLVAPTPARVDAMLTSIGSADPDEVVATLPPRFGMATRRLIAAPTSG